ncbi:MAG: class I SAM-dependent methyltransferase [Hyphomonadaceae bacterium]
MVMKYDSPESLARYIESEWPDFIPAAAAQKNVSSDLLAFAPRNKIYYTRIPEIVRAAMRTPPNRIYDAGAGIGRTVFELAQLYPDAEIVGAELSQQFTGFARAVLFGEDPPKFVPLMANDRRGVDFIAFPQALSEVAKKLKARAGSLDYFAAPAEALSYPRDYFDLVLSLNVVDRVPDPADFIQKVAQFVGPGGCLIMATPYDWKDAPAPKKKQIGSMTDVPLPGFTLETSTHIPYCFRRDILSEVNYRTHVVVLRRT